MKTGLPTQIDPVRLAKESRTLKGMVPQNVLPRLKESIRNTENMIDATLSFKIDGQGFVVVEGKIATTVVLECQRTLDPFNYLIESSFKLVIVSDDRMADRISLEYEPFIHDENGMVSPLAIVEEEILLSLPLVAKKELKDCDLDQNEAYFDVLDEKFQPSVQKPFAGLKKIIKLKQLN